MAAYADRKGGGMNEWRTSFDFFAPEDIAANMRRLLPELLSGIGVEMIGGTRTELRWMAQDREAKPEPFQERQPMAEAEHFRRNRRLA